MQVRTTPPAVSRARRWSAATMLAALLSCGGVVLHLDQAQSAAEPSGSTTQQTGSDPTSSPTSSAGTGSDDSGSDGSGSVSSGSGEQDSSDGFGTSDQVQPSNGGDPDTTTRGS